MESSISRCTKTIQNVFLSWGKVWNSDPLETLTRKSRKCWSSALGDHSMVMDTWLHWNLEPLYFWYSTLIVLVNGALLILPMWHEQRFHLVNKTILQKIYIMRSDATALTFMQLWICHIATTTPSMYIDPLVGSCMKLSHWSSVLAFDYLFACL